MKKFVIVCSAVMIALLCVSGITVLALSPETDTADEGAQSQPESALPAEETEPETGDVANEATSENPVHDLAETQEPTNENPVADQDHEENIFTKYMHHIEVIGESHNSTSDSAVFIPADDDSSCETVRESYPSMDELRSISDMIFIDQVMERFGNPDEELGVILGMPYFADKYYADNGEYVIVCYYLDSGPSDVCWLPIQDVSFSDMPNESLLALIVTNEK